VLKRRDILFINLAAGLVAGAILGIGEILYRELYTRVSGTVLVEETETVIKEANPDGKAE